MSIESPQVTSTEVNGQESQEQPTAAKEKRKMAYAEALAIFKEHDDSELELEQILFQERIAKNGSEAAIAGIEHKIAAAEEQRDVFADRDPFTEEAWAVRVQYLTAMKDMLALYCDMREKSPEMAGYMEEDMPWLKNTLEEAEEMVKEARADNYHVDEHHGEAA